jgi:hypothetical protein
MRIGANQSSQVLEVAAPRSEFLMKLPQRQKLIGKGKVIVDRSGQLRSAGGMLLRSYFKT